MFEAPTTHPEGSPLQTPPQKNFGLRTLAERTQNVQLMKLRRDVDMRIEPHPFAKSDFDETNPFIKEIIETGERII